MSFFERLGSKKRHTTTAPEAIQNLREIEEMLLKKQEYLEAKIDHELTLAKRHAVSNKNLALQCLKKKKRYEKQLQQIDKTFATIETQREALELANTNTAILKVMKNAAEALKNAQLDIDTEKVHKVMDDIADQQELVNEVANAVSQPICTEELDEDELEEELEALQEQDMGDKWLAVPEPKLENIGVKSKIVQKVKKEDDSEDLKKLEEWCT